MNASKSSKPPLNAAVDFGLGLIDAIGLDPQRDRVLLAVSGGPDSMAMAWLFHCWWQRHAVRHRLNALIVDHGLRPKSAAEAHFAKAQLEAIGIDAAIATVTAPPPEAGIQAWAREHRYRHLIEHAALDDAVVVTAHHAGDQAETLLMRLDHGSGLAGLAGMAKLTHRHGLRLARPFLDLDPASLHACLADSGFETVDDPSNHNPRFERVRARQELAADPALAPRLIQLASASAAIDRVVQSAIAAAMAGKIELMPEGWGWLDRAAFSALPPQAGETVLARLIRAMATAPRPVEQASLARLREALIKGRPATLGGCEWRHGDGRILCLAEAERLPSPQRLEGGVLLYDRRWLIQAERPVWVEPMGAQRFAALRRADAAWSPPPGVPARAFWRLPVLRPEAHSAVPGMQALDDGAFIPHLLERDSFSMPGVSPYEAMRFTGFRFPILGQQMERL